MLSNSNIPVHVMSCVFSLLLQLMLLSVGTENSQGATVAGENQPELGIKCNLKLFMQLKQCSVKQLEII